MPSAQMQRAMAAVKAMKLIGFDQGVAKTVLKKLLKVYENKWEYIEAENYRLLVDSILDYEDSKDSEANGKDATVNDEAEISRKRLRHNQEDPGPSLLENERDATVIDEAEISRKRPSHNQEDLGPSLLENDREASGGTLLKRKKMAAPVESPLINLRGETIEPAEALGSSKGRDGERPEKGTLVLNSRYHKDEQYLCGRAGNALCYKEPKIEQGSEVLQEIVAVCPSTFPDRPLYETCNNTSGGLGAPMCVLAPCGIASEKSEKGAMSEFTSSHEGFSTNVNIASSNMGKSAADLASESGNSQKSLKGSESPCIHRRLTRRSLISSSNLVSSETPREITNGVDSSQHVGDSTDIQENIPPESSNYNGSQCLADLRQHENSIIASAPLLDENDIAKGEEQIRISLINEFTSEKAPPYFNYIPCNVIYQDAHVKISLAQIGEKDCCLNCFGNCLSAPVPCTCARETGGEFVYTLNGLLKKEFLNECISINGNPGKHRLYCKSCPIEKSRTKDTPDPCKGHLVRKFIKECWSKCGCNKQCGNRVVQRGITHKLQVFYTKDGKGWGLRTLEELPKGSFVCEYVGEILTNRELFDRLQWTRGTNQTYPVLLDADWGSEEELRDEEALCLDSTFYGNIGRFVNHSCSDANLIGIPVEWETPDHHYYHLAYFTMRKIEALEELTCDYGIDFKNPTHLIKTFKCLCGSRFCRGKSKARSRASASK